MSKCFPSYNLHKTSRENEMYHLKVNLQSYLDYLNEGQILCLKSFPHT